MSHYKQGEVDFIIRTKSILEQYETLNSNNPEEKYEITLFINCLVGLIVIPQQVWYNSIPEVEIDNTWGIEDSDITVKENDYKFNLEYIARHIRNAVSHGHISPVEKGGTGNITHLEITDYNPPKNGVRGKQTFEAILSIEAIKLFAIKFADTMLKVIEEYK